jgi:hypothetical protein
MLLILPDDLAAFVVTEWLDLRLVAKLDNAVCSTFYRHRFLLFLKEKCVFATVPKLKPKHPVLIWMCLRSVRAQHLDINWQEMKINLYGRWIEQSCAVLRSVTTKTYSDEVANYLQLCTHLINIDISYCSCEFNDCLLAVVRCNKILQTLNIQICSVSACSLEGIKDAFIGSKIAKLSITWNAEDNDEFLLSMFSYLSHLKCLQLLGMHIKAETWIALSELCPHILSLNLDGFGMHDDTFEDCMRNFTGLQHLTVFYLTDGKIGAVTKYQASSLRYFYIYSDALRNCSPALVTNMLNQCKKLRLLDIFVCEYDVGNILEVLNGMSKSNISVVCIEGECVAEVTCAIVRLCPQLTTLCVDCEDLRQVEEGLVHFSSAACPLFRKFYYTSSARPQNIPDQVIAKRGYLQRNTMSYPI